MNHKHNWINRFFDMAKLVASWSKDPASKVGAVVIRPDKTVASVGFNGFAKGIKDDCRLLDRELKNTFILHAEENAILSARERLDGYTIFVYPYHPCAHCASVIIQSGIKEVYIVKTEVPTRWAENFKIANKLFEEAGVKLVTYDLDNRG